MISQIINQKLKFKPNLVDYHTEYQDFNWHKEIREFNYFTDEKMNAANFSNYFSDRTTANKAFLIFNTETEDKKEITFEEIDKLSNKFAQYLQSLGVKKGDRVFTFLPRVPEVYIGFLGAIKMGAVAGNFFAAFGQQALFDRLDNSKAKVILTNRELFPRIEAIKNKLNSLEKVLLIEELGKELNKYNENYDCCHMEPDDPCYMLYTSSTGNTPVCGIVTPHKAIIQQVQTAKWVLDLKQEDVYWCTADPGWVTGTVYGILVPWNLRITQVVLEGRFNPSKWFSALQNNQVTVWYTAPTALRMLKAEEENTEKYNFTSLRHICSVGEALPADTIRWSLKTFKLPVHDTWWQTETGAIMLANYPGVPIKPGSMGKPTPGLEVAILNDELKKLPFGIEGDLAFRSGWPSMMVDVFGNSQQYNRYFKNEWFITGDKAIEDKDGYFWFVGRADDVIKTSGERVGPFEVESTLMEFPDVAEAGVIGKPDPVRGQIIKAFIVLKPGVNPSDDLILKLQKYVKTNLAGHAYPREIEFIDKLPKNRSGKIVRRLLKAKELGLPLGDTSTIENY